MSIASEITRISGNVADAYTAANAKGATMPVTQNSDNLASTISTIQTGTTPTGTIQITTNGTHDVTNYATADIQVPTTAPAHYIEKGVDANGKLIGGSTIMSFSGVTDVGDYVMYYAYYNNTNISGAVDMSDLTQITGSNACNQMFYGCTGITSVDLSSLTTVNDYNACNNMFYSCTGLTSIDLSSLTTVSGSSACFNMFYGCTGITSVDLSSLTTVSGQYGCSNMFYGCTGITSVDFSNVTTVGYDSFGGAFSGCTSLTSVDFSNVFSVDSYSFSGAFTNTSVSSLSFNNLVYQTTANNTTFEGMLSGVTGCTVHFPADWQSEVSSWTSFLNGFGGTNTIISFDLPAITSFDFSSLTSFSDIPVRLSGSLYPHVTSVDLSGVTSSTGGSGLFSGNIYVETIDLSGIHQLDGQDRMFSNCTSLTSVDLSGVTQLANTGQMFSGSGACSVDLSGITDITTAVGDIFSGGGVGSVDLSGVTTITGSCYMFFNNCTSLTSVDLTGLTTINNNHACDQMFNNCTSLTSIDLSSLTTISGQYACQNMFLGTSVTNVKFDNLSTVTGNSCLYYMFKDCSSLISAYFPKLTVSPDFTSQTRPVCFGQIFYLSSIEIIDLRNFRSCGDYGWLDNFMANTSYLTTVNVNALEHIGEEGARAMFWMGNSLTTSTLRNVYFPMLTSFGTNPFYTNAFQGRLGVTIHFRKDMQATVQALPNYSTLWGAGTGSSVVFDLAGTLTGADGNLYARSEKDSVYASETAGAAKTATAWSYNNTVYYTSGGTEPQVGDTIYSDSACTTVVTTVDTVA